MKTLIKTVAFLLVVFLLSGCVATNTSNPAGTEADADNSWQYIKDKGEFIVGLDDTFAPMGFRDPSGNLIGFDIDLATAVVEKMGVEVKFQPIDWDAKELELSAKKIDCIWNGMSITPERQESMLLSDPYLNNTIVIMTKSGSDIKSKNDLEGKKIGVQAKSAGLEVIQSDEIYDSVKDNLSEYKTYDEAIMDLEIGRIEAVIIDEVLGRYTAAKKEGTFDFADEKFADDLYAIGMRKGEEALGAELAKAMKAVIEDGTAKEISEKWFGKDIVIK